MRLWGFPYRLSVTFENLRWHDPQSAADWDLQADSVTAHLQLWKLEHVIFDLGGSQRLGWRPAAGAARQQAILTSARFLASMATDAAGAWQRFDTDIRQPKLDVGLPDGPALGRRLGPAGHPGHRASEAVEAGVVDLRSRGQPAPRLAPRRRRRPPAGDPDQRALSRQHGNRCRRRLAALRYRYPPAQARRRPAGLGGRATAAAWPPRWQRAAEHRPRAAGRQWRAAAGSRRAFGPQCRGADPGRQPARRAVWQDAGREETGRAPVRNPG